MAESNDLPILPPDLKPVPAEHEDAWQKIQQREGDRYRKALYLVAQGLTPNRAARLASFPQGSTILVYDKAKHYGLYRPREEQIAQQALEVAHLSGDGLIGILTEDPDELDPKQLAVVWGIAQDKQIKREQLRKDEPNTEPSLSELARAIVEQGGSLELTVKGSDHTGPVTIQAEPEQD